MGCVCSGADGNTTAHHIIGIWDFANQTDISQFSKYTDVARCSHSNIAIICPDRSQYTYATKTNHYQYPFM